MSGAGAPAAGPRPEGWLAEVHNPHTGETELSLHGVAYYGSNWRLVRWLPPPEHPRAASSPSEPAPPDTHKAPHHARPR